MRKQYLRAAAEAFAGVNQIESACYHYVEHGHDDCYRQLLAQHYCVVMRDRCPNLKPSYIDAIVNAALTELTYPVINKSNYSWTGRQRAAATGIASSTWHRNNLCDGVNFIIDDIRRNAHTTYHLVENNLSGVSADPC